ncbi:MAG: hypothetical protein II800_02350 [Lachnospiraceae bacterium]|nr:hypothetical protein [Lachnospiraceae bacterium]
MTSGERFADRIRQRVRQTGVRWGSAALMAALCLSLYPFLTSARAAEGGTASSAAAEAGTAATAATAATEPEAAAEPPRMEIGEGRATAESLIAANSFAVVIPPEFVPGDQPGQYVTEHWPLDAACITVTSVPLDEEKRYTNAERREMVARGEEVPMTRRDYTSLTAQRFEREARAALADGMTLKVTSFVNIRVKRDADGASFPGFRISTEIGGASKTIRSEIYLILSANRVFTVTYAQAEDDDFEELFRKSADTIRAY